MKTKQRKKQVRSNKRNKCANCNRTVTGNFCSNCGQSTREVRQPFWRVFLTFLGEAFSFDGKFFQTLELLILKPWVLVQDFMNGKRICYTPPFRMYLFATFFAFLLLSFTYNSAERNYQKDRQVFRNDSIVTKTDSTKYDLPKTFIDDIARGYAGSELDKKTKKSVDSRIQKTLIKISNFADKQPFLFIDIFLKSISQALLILFPLFAFLLAFFYYDKKRYFLEHLLLSLNFHTFIFILFIVISLIKILSFNHLEGYPNLLYILILVQLYRTLRNYYGQSRRITIFKFLVLSLIYLILLFLMLLMSLSFLLYKFW